HNGRGVVHWLRVTWPAGPVRARRGGVRDYKGCPQFSDCVRVVHLARDFQALADSEDGVGKRLGHDLLRPKRELFRQWSRCCDGTVSRGWLNDCVMPVRSAVEGLLLRGLFSGPPRLVGMCRELYEHRAWLWTFLEQEVEPTNNASERALRHAVIWR